MKSKVEGIHQYPSHCTSTCISTSYEYEYMHANLLCRDKININLICNIQCNACVTCKNCDLAHPYSCPDSILFPNNATVRRYA